MNPQWLVNKIEEMSADIKDLKEVVRAVSHKEVMKAAAKPTTKKSK